MTGLGWDGLVEMFNPGHRHLREERDRKRIEARIPGTGAGPNSVDLERGIVRITRPASSPYGDSPTTTRPDPVEDPPT